MRRRTGMEAVELVERDDVPPRPEDPGDVARGAGRDGGCSSPCSWPSRSSARRSSWRRANVPRSRRSRRCAGVVRPVDEDVRILWTLDAGTQWVLWSGQTGGVLVGLQRASDGSQALVAVDELTGERRWTTPLADAHVDHAEEGFSPVGGCAAEPGDSGRIVCLVTDAYLAFRQTRERARPVGREPDRRRGQRGRFRRGRARGAGRGGVHGAPGCRRGRRPPLRRRARRHRDATC